MTGGSGLRVIAGELRGRRFRAPSGRRTRPTTDRVRESLFSLLGPGPPGSRVLDLFAGSGALGIEALSRGALRAVFVERDRSALAVLRRNLADLGLVERGRVVPGDVFGAASWPEAPFDLILADPPYGAIELPVLAERARAALAPGGAFVLERSADEPPPAVSGLALRKDRRYGDTAIALYSAVEEEDPT